MLVGGMAVVSGLSFWGAVGAITGASVFANTQVSDLAEELYAI
jgi:hypothetical protein